MPEPKMHPDDGETLAAKMHETDSRCEALDAPTPDEQEAIQRILAKANA